MVSCDTNEFTHRLMYDINLLGTESDESPKKPEKTPKPQKFTSLLIKNAPHSTGKISMAKDKNVGFEIKNGQMTFKYRRSPRKNKSPYFQETRTPNADPKAPKQLFTPSSKSDFINDWQASPPKSNGRSRLNLPSPVKFHTETDEKEEEASNETVSDLINNLDNSQDDHAMYVTDDELASISAKIAQEVMETPIETVVQSENIGLQIQDILANLEPPTANEVKENRSSNNLQLVLDEDDSSNDAFETPTKKNFPIFDKNSRKNPKEVTPKASRNNNARKNIDDDQMIIDAGQKSLTDVKTCLECSFVYNPGNKQDENEHEKIHNIAQEGVKFSGWKNENVVGEFPAEQSRIIVVRPKDHNSHWAKVNEVLNVVDKQLGVIIDENSDAIRNKDGSQVIIKFSVKLFLF